MGAAPDACQIIKKETCRYQMPGISNSGGTSLGWAVSSTGATREPFFFFEFIEFDKICFIFLHKIVWWKQPRRELHSFFFSLFLYSAGNEKKKVMRKSHAAGWLCLISHHSIYCWWCGPGRDCVFTQLNTLQPAGVSMDIMYPAAAEQLIAQTALHRGVW